MSRRLIKQIIYGSFYFIIIFGFIYIIYFFVLKPIPSCFDGKKNQSEEGIDCGGPCPPCELKELKLIQILPVGIVSLDGKTSALIELRNPNINWGADKFYYELNFYDSAGEKIFSLSKDSFIYPGEVKYIAEINLDVDYQKISRSEFTIINEPSWKPASEFPLPKISSPRGISTEYNQKEKKIIISGIWTNENPFSVSEAVIIGVLWDNLGRRVGISKTLLSGIKPREQKAFRIILTTKDLINFDPSATEVFVEVKK